MVVPSNMINKKTETKALRYQWFRPWLSESAIFSIWFTVGRKLSGCFTMGGDSTTDHRSGKSRPETDRQSMIRTFTIFGDEWQKHACLGWAVDPGRLQTWTPHWLDHRKSQVQLSALHRKCYSIRKESERILLSKTRLWLAAAVWLDQISNSLIIQIQMYSGNVSLQIPSALTGIAEIQIFKTWPAKALASFFFRGWNAGQFEASGAWHSWTSYVQRCLAKCHGKLPG